MKERPILFSAPMVRAILAGTKTQTRRAVAELEQYRCSALTVLVQCRFWMQHQLPMGSGGGLDSAQNKVREAMLARIDEVLR